MISPDLILASYYVSFQTFIYYVYSVVSAYMSAQHVYIVPAKAREGDVKSPRTRVRETCQSQGFCPLKEQLVL